MLDTLAYRARGAMSEPNLFGSLLLVPFAVALWRWIGPPHVAKRPGAAALALSVGLVFAATRAAWVAALVVAWLSPLRRRMRGRQLRQLALGAAAAAGLLLASDLVLRQGSLRATSLYDRLVPGEGTGFDGPLDVRLAELRAGLSSWRESPWFGHGAGSGKMLTQYVHGRRWTFVRTEPWISNGILFILHDSGLVGLALFVVAAGAVGRQWWRARAQMGDLDARIDHEALGAGLAAVLLAWQATHGLWQMYGYLYLGLLLAMSRFAKHEGATISAAP
jgi:O-antigen ligase